MELFRSKRTQHKINKLRLEVAEANRAWRATWVKQADGSYRIPADKARE